MAFTIDVHLSPEEVRSQMLADALQGLQGEQKSIPPVWFYDERGSRLFEDITQQPEYYPTRAERALLEAHARARLHAREGDGEARHGGVVPLPLPLAPVLGERDVRVSDCAYCAHGAASVASAPSVVDDASSICSAATRRISVSCQAEPAPCRTRQATLV